MSMTPCTSLLGPGHESHTRSFSQDNHKPAGIERPGTTLSPGELRLSFKDKHNPFSEALEKHTRVPGFSSKPN